MTDDDARILRAITAGICDTLDAAVNITSRVTDAYSGQPVALLFEHVYQAIRAIKEGPEMQALKSAGIPPSMR